MEHLEAYGLNTYESKVYLTLVRQGMCTAHIVSKESSVPYGKIYPVLASLEKKGFVKLFDGVPKRFAAVEPKIVFENTLEKKKKEFEQFKQKSRHLVASLGELSQKKPKEPFEAVRIIEGYDNYLNLSVALHNKAKEEWLSITRLEVYKKHYDSTKECIKRGVAVKLLTFGDENRKRIELWRKIGAEVRFIEYIPTHFSVIDNKEVTVRILGEERYLALWLRNKALAEHMRAYFMMLWKGANK